jgi:poly-beta-1,6-N-acetyl-D-glucosamine synthase
MKYIVISPVKDEERNIERTLQSMIAQSHLPELWVIVDDGSTDRTPVIVEQFASKYPFIRLFRNERRSARQTGIAEVLAFNAGLQQVGSVDYDFVVKLDGDLSFDPNYFQELLRRMAENPKIGIASGVYMEDRGTGWETVPMPDYHAFGASKVLRRECFEAIGGFIAERGWDTVDEIRARTVGWHTTHFSDLKTKHWKPEGTGMGMLRTCYMHGEIYYRTGGSLLFFLLKSFRRLFSPPYFTGACAVFWGYLNSFRRRREPLVSPAEAACYRTLLNNRLFGAFSRSRQLKEGTRA